ncbi:MAG: hypothetical protein WCT19_03585 [Candidatus Paceibacterota bacterium]|jgi:hypothetical protein
MKESFNQMPEYQAFEPSPSRDTEARKKETQKILDANWQFSDYEGRELEETYLKKFQEVFPNAKIVGGIGDAGLDIQTGDNEIPKVQVKWSSAKAKEFVIKSISRFKEFIPICVGDPKNSSGSEIVQSLKEFGGFAGPDIPRKEELIHGISTARDMIISGQN